MFTWSRGGGIGVKSLIILENLRICFSWWEFVYLSVDEFLDICVKIEYVSSDVHIIEYIRREKGKGKDVPPNHLTYSRCSL